jgi:hypothetical protein
MLWWWKGHRAQGAGLRAQGKGHHKELKFRHWELDIRNSTLEIELNSHSPCPFVPLSPCLLLNSYNPQSIMNIHRPIAGFGNFKLKLYIHCAGMEFIQCRVHDLNGYRKSYFIITHCQSQAGFITA